MNSFYFKKPLMKVTISFGLAGFLLLSLTNCKELSLDDRPRRRRSDPAGEVELPEEVMEADFFDFKNCKPSVDAPDNSLDIITDTVIPGKNPLRNARTCLKDRLERAHGRICKARAQLEEQRERAQDSATRTRIENQIYRLDQIQWRFNQQLNKLADSTDKNIEKMENRRKSKNNFLIDFASFFGEQELSGWRNILDIESYTECHDENRSRREDL